jgi:threonine aldolase
MLKCMMHAAVGDEQIAEDPTTRHLEERVAHELGQESAIFLPTGTMCNQIAFLVHCRPGDEIVASRLAHIVTSEGAGGAALAGAAIQTIDTRNGIFTADQLRHGVRPQRDRSPRSRVVVIEQTSNRGGGAVWPLDVVKSIQREARSLGLAVHMDGARLFNAVVAADVELDDFTRECDSVWVDFTKSLGCPFGAVLAGSADFVKQAWRWKHRLGGAMRQSGFMAAACLYAMDNNVRRLADDHANAKRFAEGIEGRSGIMLAFPDIETNMVFVDLSETGVSAENLLNELAPQGIRLSMEGPHLLRAVTHMDVSADDVAVAANAMVAAVENIQNRTHVVRSPEHFKPSTRLPARTT